MDINQDPELKQFASLISKLKALLKCPICLDVIQEAVELECSHKLCDTCYHALVSKGKFTSCPICKASIKKRCSLYKDKYSDAVGKFVHIMGMQLESVYKQKVEMLAAASPIDNRTSKASKSSSKLPKQKVTSTLTKENRDMKKLPVRQVKASECLKSNLKINNCLENSQNGIFDTIAGTSENTIKFNKKGTRNVYTNRKKGSKTKIVHKVLDFDDDKNKKAVLDWLNDNRNEFDRLTQTQMMIPSSGEHSMAMNLPSVSQRRLLDTGANTISKKWRRTKSLEIEKERIETPRRYSDSPVREFENYNIEDPNTEGIISVEKVIEKAKENVIFHLLEDEYLDKLDYEIAAPSKMTCDDKIEDKKINDAGISMSSCNSGWNRVSQMKETVDKSGKLPKQLGITIQNVEKNDLRKKEWLNSDQYMDHSLPEAETIQLPQHLEDNISKNIECATPLTKSVCGRPSVNTLNNNQIHVKSNTPAENKSRLFSNVHGDSSNTGILVNEKDKMLQENDTDGNTCNKSEKSPSYILHQNPDSISKLNNNQEDDTEATSSTIVDKNTHHVNASSNHENVNILTDAPDTRNLIALHGKDDTTNPNNEYDEYLNDYDLPTQKMTSSNVPDILRESTNKLLNYINEYIQMCSKEVDSHCAMLAIDQIKAYVGRLKQIDVVNTSVQTSQVSKKDVFVETEFQTCDESVQTEGVSTNICSVQTMEISKQDVGLQTEPSNCENSFKDVSDKSVQRTQILDRTSPNTSPNKSQKNDVTKNVGNELFTNSFDNVVFNTLEVFKNPSIKLDRSFETVVNRNVTSNSKCDIPEKELDHSKVSKDVPSIKDQLPSTGKEAVFEISCFGATHSNQKRPRDETEIEEMIKPKKKRNRFINDVLSVEFDNTLDREATQQRESMNKSSPEVNKSVHSHPPHNIGNACWEPAKNTSNLDRDLLESRERGEKNYNFKIKRPTKYLDEYDEIIAKVSENVERLTKQAQLAEKNNHRPMEKIISPTKSISTLKLEEFKEQFPGYSSDIISGSESFGRSPKKPEMKGLDRVNSLDQSTHCTPPHVSQTDREFDIIEPMEVCQELEDSFDEQFANIHFSAGEKNDGKSKMKILTNVIVKRPKVDDDLFSEDEDVVESTPQNRSPASECGAGSNNIIEGEDEGLDFPALPPPPAFQDGTFDEMATDETLKPDNSIHIPSPSRKSKRSLASEFLCEDNHQEEEPNTIAQKKMIHSTPKASHMVSGYTLGLSPIKEYTVSQASSCITKRNILTSTPRQKSMWNYVRPSQSPKNSALDITAIEGINSNSKHTSQTDKDANVARKKPCISFTRLSKDKVMCISQMTSKKLATHTSTFDKSVTHLIVSVDKSGCAKDYTVKFMAAIASGIWVLKFDWVQKCLDTNSIVSEEPYEALDDTGGQGPRNARLTRLKEPLLRNFKFYITEPLFSTTRQDIEDIIKMLGGMVASSPDLLKNEPGCIKLIITEGRATQDFEIYDRWLEQYKVVTIDIEWLSKSVGRYKQISFRPYIWCSDESLDELNYPDHLIEVVPYSVDQ